MAAKAHLVLYVPRRGKQTTLCALYVEFTPKGRLKRITTDVPRRTTAPWLQIQKKEFTRLCEEHNLKRSVGRPVLSPEEQHAHKLRSGEKYRKSIAALREHLGKPLSPIPLGQRAPDDDVNRVLELMGQSNPATGKPYTGRDIAIEVGRSASFVSRVKNGQRRTATTGEPTRTQEG